MKIEFTEDQMQAIAILLNNAEGKHDFNENQLLMAIAMADKVWQNMNSQYRIANPTAL